jgi:hypothetical protein
MSEHNNSGGRVDAFVELRVKVGSRWVFVGLR